MDSANTVQRDSNVSLEVKVYAAVNKAPAPRSSDFTHMLAGVATATRSVPHTYPIAAIFAISATNAETISPKLLRFSECRELHLSRQVNKTCNKYAHAPIRNSCGLNMYQKNKGGNTMLKAFRRHLKSCPHRGKGRKYAKCSCPVWVGGKYGGKPLRRSLDTCNWEQACRTIMDIEAGINNKKDKSIADGVQKFLGGCAKRLAVTTFDRYRLVLMLFLKFCSSRGITRMRAIDCELLTDFVGTLHLASRTVRTRIGDMRVFFNYAVAMGWCDTSPAARLKLPRITEAPVVPFSREEDKAILAAVDSYPTRNTYGYDNRARVRAFVLTLRYTGLRIGDVVKLTPDRLKDERLLLYTSKAGTPVHLPVPQILVHALKVIRKGNNHYFWTGVSRVKSGVTGWELILSKLFKLAGVKGHAHMYRHTLATELLIRGVPIENIAMILGNTPEIVRKHYAPWIAARQKALDESVMSTWDATSVTNGNEEAADDADSTTEIRPQPRNATEAYYKRAGETASGDEAVSSAASSSVHLEKSETDLDEGIDKKDEDESSESTKKNYKSAA